MTEPSCLAARASGRGAATVDGGEGRGVGGGAGVCRVDEVTGELADGDREHDRQRSRFGGGGAASPLAG